MVKSLGKERMSTEKEQIDLGGYNGEPEFLQGVVTCMRENRKWQGTAEELGMVLGLTISPRSVSVQLKKAKENLEKLGISVAWGRNRKNRIVSITNSGVASHSETTLRHVKESTTNKKGFASHIKKEPTTFPYSWRYGKIEELDKEEKISVNRVQHDRRKRYQKSCAICGKEGILECRKTSGDAPVLICRTCAEEYVSCSLMLQLNGIGEME